jgi:beta-glucosidase
VAIVFITADSGEEYILVEKNTGDHNDLDAWHSGADLVKAVVGVKNTIVPVNTVGPILKLSQTYRT